MVAAETIGVAYHRLGASRMDLIAPEAKIGGGGFNVAVPNVEISCPAMLGQRRPPQITVRGVDNARLALIYAVRWRGDGFVAGMRRRDMSANDYTIAESERRIGVEKSQETTS